MKIKLLTPTTTLLVLEKDEPVIATLTKFCEETNITAATLSAIGAVSTIKCGYYDLTKREYFFTMYPDLYEVVSLSANVAMKDTHPFVHMHGVFSDTQNQTFGGHVVEMVVGVTLEVFLTTLPGSITRRFNDVTGLYLLTDE